MDEFRTFCYLDVPKTGSTFVSDFLTAHISEPRLRAEKHGRITEPRDPQKLYFITVREPLDHYASLYFFGRRGLGMLRRRLETSGHGGLYEGGPDSFAVWLEFMLDPANAVRLGERYAEAAPELYGFQTFRHLALAFDRPMARLKSVRERGALTELYASSKIVSRVLRAETLNADLRALVETDLNHAVKDIDAAVASLPVDRTEVADGSDAKAAVAALPARLRALVEQREWFLYDIVGYPRSASVSGGVALGAATP